MPYNESDLASRQAAADQAFESYDFGSEVEVVDHDNWNTEDLNDLTKIVYASYSGDAPDLDTHKLSFHVRFTPGSSHIQEAYALDFEHGNEIGSPGVYSETNKPNIS
jgi:hypothetical protein